MIVCPVCEHHQEAGSECEVCGRHLVAGRGTDAPVVPLEGLEQTAFAAIPTPAAGLDAALADLEATRFEAADVLLVEVVPDVEPTRAEAVEVEVEATPDLERTLAEPLDDGASPILASAVCRYCRTEAPPGEAYCGRCGMHLSTYQPPASSPSVPPAICSCGAPVTRSRCPACGARHTVG
jgi:hypothetical protein